MAEIKRIERGLGRTAEPRNAPRIIDIDLLLYGSFESSLPELEVPHPRLRERHFVLAPLARVAGDWKVPPDHRPVEMLLADLGPGKGIREVPWTMDPLPSLR